MNVGNGEVEYEYYDKSGERHYVDGECPICNGEGSNEKDSKFARIKLSKIKTKDGEQIGIYINDLYFHPFQLYRLFMVASLKRLDEFELQYSEDKYQTLSTLGNIKVLTMCMTKPIN